MEAHEIFGSITVRMPASLIQELDNLVKAKQFKDRSEALRSLTQLGVRTKAIMEIQRDPKRKKEFEQKFKHLVQKQNMEETLQTFDIEQLDAAAFFITNLRKEKYKQELLALNRY